MITAMYLGLLVTFIAGVIAYADLSREIALLRRNVNAQLSVIKSRSDR